LPAPDESFDAPKTFSGNTQKMVCRLQGGGGKFLPPTKDVAHDGPDNAGAQHIEGGAREMNTNMTFRQLADFGMPMSASVRVLPMTGVVSAVAVSAQRTRVDATPVCGYSHITDAGKGAFPGTSAWRPPN
jgi:hypothetical protein